MSDIDELLERLDTNAGNWYLDDGGASKEAAATIRALREANDRLRNSIGMAIRCTPHIGQEYVGISGLTYRNVIKYDCGNPWDILTAALEASHGRVG